MLASAGGRRVAVVRMQSSASRAETIILHLESASLFSASEGRMGQADGVKHGQPYRVPAGRRWKHADQACRNVRMTGLKKK